MQPSTLYTSYIINFLHVKATDLLSIIIDISKTAVYVIFLYL